MVKLIIGFLLMLPFMTIVALPYDSPIVYMLDVATPVFGLVVGGTMFFMGLIQIIVPHPGVRRFSSRNDIARIRFEVENRGRRL